MATVKEAQESVRQEKERLLLMLREKARRETQRTYYQLFPDETTGEGKATIHARRLYPKQLEHFAAGAEYQERMLRCANRVGKTISGAYEVTGHLTGEYPHWWPGKRFDHPTDIWVAGKTGETTRDIIQAELFGKVVTYDGRKGFDGTGMVPGNMIGSVTWRSGLADAADTVRIRHVASNGWSTLGFKSYNQGRGSFEGTAKDVIWCDEEPPGDVYNEALIRLMTTGGIMIITFTPLEGLSQVVMGFMPQNELPDA